MSQQAFTQALMAPDTPVPAGVVDPHGRVSLKRFNIYRNNVVSSLCDALEVAFPAVQALVGPEFFREMAKIFVRAHPPQSPILARYGAALPAFLQGFAPAVHLRYLPDVARLENALRASYHGPDHTPLEPATLGAIAPEDLGALKVALAPSARLLRSDWPVLAIWTRALGDPDTPLPEGGQDVLVARAEFDPAPLALPAGAFAFFTALAQGQPLGAAAQQASESAPEFDAAGALQLALAQRLLCAFEQETLT